MFAALKKRLFRCKKTPAERHAAFRERMARRNFYFYCGPSYLRQMPLEVSIAWNRRENPRCGEFMFARQLILIAGWPRFEWRPIEPCGGAERWTGRTRELVRAGRGGKWFPVSLRLERFERPEETARPPIGLRLSALGTIGADDVRYLEEVGRK